MSVRPFRLGFPAALATLALDQITKAAVLAWMTAPPIPLTPFFNLTLSFNAGVTFGIGRRLGADGASLLAVGAAVIIAMLLWWLSRAKSRVEACGIGLIIGGALGNVVDRLRQGAVTDWLDLHVAAWHWPIFNLADVAIVSGVALLLSASLLPQRYASRRALGGHLRTRNHP